MPNLVVDITNSDVFTALGNFLQSVFPDIEIIWGQQNLLPMPKGQFITMTQSSTKRVSTNVNSYIDFEIPGANQGFKNISTPTDICINLNIYGKDSADFTATLQNVFRDEYSYDAFPSNIKPLYMTEPHQMPLIDGEHQYSFRWITSVHLMYTPTVQINQQFADQFEVNIFEETDLL